MKAIKQSTKEKLEWLINQNLKIFKPDEHDEVLELLQEIPTEFDPDYIPLNREAVTKFPDYTNPSHVSGPKKSDQESKKNK